MTLVDSNPALRYADASPLGSGQRVLAIVLALVVHGLLAVLILRGLGASIVGGQAGAPPPSAYNVPLDPPPPPPPRAPPTASPSRAAEGAQGAAGRKARATQIVAARARIPTPTVNTAPAASTGNDTRSGASAAGEGTGGSSAGSGTGSGGAGNGAGGRTVAARPVKIAGEITSARDYPREGRDTRLGRSVVIMLTVGTDGRVAGCKVHRPSGDPQADAVTCRLATQRFRFRPALDQQGNPIEAPYGWEQRWFTP
ncbi:MAG: TonB family protein [Proteobacteria bacterium]|nr:TonB family protein [Pseudomonadota bacterium]